MHGFYYKPRISKKFLADHSKGLIGLSGCLAVEATDRLITRYKDEFEFVTVSEMTIHHRGTETQR